MLNQTPIVRVGDVIEHPITGEKMIFRQTGAETNGELLQIDLFVQPGGFVAAEHIHPHQAERFVVQAGTITLQVNGQQQTLHAGQEATVPPQTPHVWWNSGPDELRVLLEFRPAGHFAEFITSLFALAQNGQANATGRVNLVPYAVMDRKYSDVLIVTNPPRALQRVLFALLYPLGRLLGYTADNPYPKQNRPAHEPDAAGKAPPPVTPQGATVR